MMMTFRSIVAAAAAAAMTVSLATACSTDGDGDGDAGSIALLLPESQTTRYESFDRPYFEERMAQLCPDCDVVYANADGDPSRQQQQAESALSQGVDVLVLGAVDSAAAASTVAAATAQGVDVISYDRLIDSPALDYYISFDNELVGVLQGQALVERMEQADAAHGGILMINGASTDPNAQAFKAGAHSVIDASNLTILAEFDNPDWSPSAAQDWTSSQVIQFGTRIDGVYAANDGTAGGSIAAMKAEGFSPVPPVTGQDAELAAIQRIVAGDQYMTVYKAIRQQARTAAEAAYALLNDRTPDTDTSVNGIPAVLLEPVPVTVDTIMETVVADGFYTVEQICTPNYAVQCAAAGIE